MSKRQVTCFNQFQLTSYKRSGSKELSNLWAPHGSTHTWNTLDSSRMLNSERHEAGGHVHDVIHKHIGREAALEQLAKDAIDGGHRGQGHIEQGKLQDETGAQAPTGSRHAANWAPEAPVVQSARKLLTNYLALEAVGDVVLASAWCVHRCHIAHVHNEFHVADGLLQRVHAALLQQLAHNLIGHLHACVCICVMQQASSQHWLPHYNHPTLCDMHTQN
eukprot:1158208-Pelagomonas_calceolata.AAC.20